MILHKMLRIEVAAVCLIAVTAGCTGNLDYATQGDRQALKSLAQGRIGLVRHRGDKSVEMVGPKYVPEPLAEELREYEKTQLSDAFQQTLEIVDITRQTGDIDPANAAQLAAKLSELDLDGALVVLTDYGYRMNKSVAEHIAEDVQEEYTGTSSPEIPFLNDVSTVEYFCLRSKITLHGADGKIAWSFDGKATRMPSVWTPGASVRENLHSHWNRFAGLEPDEQELVVQFGPMSKNFVHYASWLLAQDAQDAAERNYFKDYPSSEENLPIYPAASSWYHPLIIPQN